PRMDLYDHPDSPKIMAIFELPGVKIADLLIAVKAGKLSVQGHRCARYLANRIHPSLQVQHSDLESNSVDAPSDTQNTPSQAGAHTYSEVELFRQEIRYGPFFRSVRLPSEIDSSRISASLCDGLLTVSWPRPETVANEEDQSSNSTISESSEHRGEGALLGSRHSSPI
ncbi:hypothetical protein C8R43DRAFT_885105, partial [Mycena crocata]